MTLAASAPRFVLGAPIAALVTVMLVMLMQSLVAQRGPGPQERVTTPSVQIVSEKIETPPERGVRPTKPDDVVTPPPTPLTDADAEAVAPGPTVVLPPPVVTPPETSGPLTPLELGPRLIFTPKLEYPQRMYPREGSCTVGYDITATGATTNVHAIACTSSGFAGSAERMVGRFQYQPAQNRNGPVASYGHRADVVFEVTQ